MQNIVLNEVKNNVITIDIFGEIGFSWFGDGFTVNDLINQLKNQEFDTIQINIQSLGGSVYDAIMIYDLLKDYKSKGVKVITKGIGLIASAASTILVAGDERSISNTSMMLVHFASTSSGGKEEDLESALEIIKNINENLLDIYQEVTGKSREELTQLLDEDRWMNAKEAKKWGFITKINTIKVKNTNMVELVNKVNNSNLPKIEMEDEKNNDIIMNYEEIYNQISSLVEVSEDSNLEEVITNKLKELEDIKNVISVKDEEIVNLNASITEKDETILELTNSKNELVNQLEDFNKQKKEMEIENILTDAISKNKINSALKEDYRNLLVSNFEATKSLLGKMNPTKTTTLLNEVVEVENDERKDWTILDWQKKDPEGLKNMSINNTSKYEKLYNDFYKK